MTLSRLNAIHCLRLYAAYYLSCQSRLDEDRELYGQPLWSNHFRDRRQVFYGYHWLIRQDGVAERLLEDKNIAWHAGSWHVNTRSLAIAFDDNLHGRQPAAEALGAAAGLIKTNYSRVKFDCIIAHSDVMSRPSQLSMAAWRDQLLSLIEG